MAYLRPAELSIDAVSWNVKATVNDKNINISRELDQMNEVDAPQGRDKRQTGRRRTIFGGVIFGPGAENWNCNVVDISEAGVRVKCKAFEELTTDMEVDLKINKYNDMRRCSVMWARDGQVGLKFLIPIDPTDETMRDLFKIVRNI